MFIYEQKSRNRNVRENEFFRLVLSGLDRGSRGELISNFVISISSDIVAIAQLSHLLFFSRFILLLVRRVI